MAKPLCIDLFAGLGGWTKGFLAEGYRCVGFDIERHVYAVTESHFGGLPKTRSTQYPAQLVLQDVLTLHGSQFKDAACIVASPPCQNYSYMAMPWSRAKAMAKDIRQSPARIEQLNALFNACFRIQMEASQAAGRHIPMVVENVKGAQPWVGRANANFGSFYLWGDIASVGGRITMPRPAFGVSIRAARRGSKGNPDGTNHGQGSWFKIADSQNRGGQKNDGGSWFNIAHNTESGVGQNPDGRHLTNQRESDGLKNPGMTSWSDYGQPGYKPQGFNVTSAQRYREAQETGVKQGGDWFGKGEDMSISRRTSSRSDSRKAASAMIAEIPFDLSRWIARCFRPEELQSKRA